MIFRASERTKWDMIANQPDRSSNHRKSPSFLFLITFSSFLKNFLLMLYIYLSTNDIYNSCILIGCVFCSILFRIVIQSLLQRSNIKYRFERNLTSEIEITFSKTNQRWLNEYINTPSAIWMRSIFINFIVIIFHEKKNLKKDL